MAAAVAPAHYIRTIHTSFTASAAHHPPRNAHAAPPAWAGRPSPAQAKEREAHAPHAQYTTQHLHYQHHLPQQQQQPGSISTHNTHYYTHHLGLAPPPPHAQAAVPVRRRPGAPPSTAAGAGAGPAHGRRRSASIRVPPAYANANANGGRVQQGYKFDPFADDEAPLSVTAPLSGGFQANRQREGYSRGGNSTGAPYTIHIPAAQPTEIMQYAPSSVSPATPGTTPSTPRSARLRSLIPINGPLPGSVPTAVSSSTTLTSTSRTPSSYSRTSLSRSPSPPSTTSHTTSASTHTQTHARLSAPQAPPNLSKIVAGILLNRVHAVGKPMRRRVLPRSVVESGSGAGAGEGYRKSCLSSVISLEL